MNNRSNMIKMGNHIADLRKKKGYTQKTLGDILDVSDKTVCKWEKGIVAPDITILKSLANTLDVTVEEILSGEEVKKINTIETLGIYSSMTKKRLIKIFIILIFIFILSTFFVFRIEQYYSWHLTQLKYEGKIVTYGYLLSNNKESKIAINRLFFNGDAPQDITKIELSIYDENNKIYSKNIDINEYSNVNDILSSYNICFETNRSISINDLVIKVLIHDSKDEINTYKIIFK